MHWIIQDNLFRERGVDELIEILDRASIPYSLHKVIPFTGEIQPDIDVDGNVIVYGAYSLRHVAKNKGWVPGCFDLANLTYMDCIEKYGDNMLNSDLVSCPFALAPFHMNENEEYFIRPTVDSKFFPGTITNYNDFMDWYEKVVVLEEDDGSNLRGSTDIFIASVKEIHKEFRLWIVDGKVATYSLYKQGGKVIYRNELDTEIKEFAKEMLSQWTPLRAFVMDIASTENGPKIIELNTFNAAGLYAANVGKIVEAIEGMEF